MSQKPQVEQDASRDQPCGAPKSDAPEAQPSGGRTPGPWVVKDEYVGSDADGLLGNIVCDAPPRRFAGSLGYWPANANLIAKAPDLLDLGWTLAVLALQSNRYRDEPDFRDAVDAMLDTCRVARGEATLAEHQAAKASAR